MCYNTDMNRPQFDRENPDAYKVYNLYTTRQQGRARARELWRAMRSDHRFKLPESNRWHLRVENPYYGMRSTAFEELQVTYCRAFQPPTWPKNSVLIDMGCGDSPDAVIAKKMGVKTAYAIDLFEPSKSVWGPLIDDAMQPVSHQANGIKFIKADYCEHIDLPDGCADMIVCSAALDLTDPLDRLLFYEQCYRLLKKGGGLSIYFVKLKAGHGFDLAVERERIKAIGFKLYRNYTGGFVFHKP